MDGFAGHNLLGQAASTALVRLGSASTSSAPSMAWPISGSLRDKSYCRINLWAWKEVGIQTWFRFPHFTLLAICCTMWTIVESLPVPNTWLFLTSFSTAVQPASFLTSSAFDIVEGPRQRLLTCLHPVLVLPGPSCAPPHDCPNDPHLSALSYL